MCRPCLSCPVCLSRDACRSFLICWSILPASHPLRPPSREPLPGSQSCPCKLPCRQRRRLAAAAGRYVKCLWRPWFCACADGVALGASGLRAFAHTVLHADMNADFIIMPREVQEAAIPAPLKHSILMRQSYRRFLRLIAGLVASNQGSGVVLTGTPGTGKSSAAVPLFCVLARRGCKVLYRLVSLHHMPRVPKC